MRGGRRGRDLLAHERPQPPCGRIQIVARHRVEPARPFRARGEPPAVAERLQVAADRGLRQLHDTAELGNGHLVALENQEEPAARRVSERREMVEDFRRTRIHPYSRMEGYYGNARLASESVRRQTWPLAPSPDRVSHTPGVG